MIVSWRGVFLTADGAADRACVSSGAGAGADGVHLHQEGLLAEPVHHRRRQGQSHHVGQLFPVGRGRHVASSALDATVAQCEHGHAIDVWCFRDSYVRSVGGGKVVLSSAVS